ncbi:MAG: hypothetical protein K6U74_02165 [Firmicutes bacterium]|nr:hypothetical protein [Bacillota bacterium]
MRYQWHGESLTTDLLSALAALGYGALTTSYILGETDPAKAKSRAKMVTFADAVVGAGGLVAKNYVSSPLFHEVLESLAYAGFGGLGRWAAAAYKKAGNIPVWHPETQQQQQATYYVAPSYYHEEPTPAPIRTGGASILEI